MRTRAGAATACAAVLVLVLVLAGCSSSGGEGGAATGPSSGPSSGSSATSSPGTGGSSATSGATTASSSSTPGTVPGVAPSAVTTIPPAHDGSLDAVHVTLTQVANLDAAATALVQRPGTDDLYVAELGGTVVRLTPGAGGKLSVATAPVLDLTGKVGTAGEEGLLGLAFSHDGTTLYVSYAAPDGTSMVDAYAMDGAVATPSTRRNLLSVEEGKGHVIHKGGALRLGPDGELWLSLGDGGPEEDPDNNAQNPKLRLGKILRIDPATGATSIWSSGLRNPFRFSFDPAGNIWIGDVGQNKVEEIDRLPAATPPGANFGWSGFEGTSVFRRDRLPARSVPPIVEMSHADGWCAVMGGVVVTDPRLPKLDGAYVFGDLCRPQIRAIRVGADGRVTAQRDLGPQVHQLTDIDADASGRVYFLTQTGKIDRLDPA